MTNIEIKNFEIAWTKPMKIKISECNELLLLQNVSSRVAFSSVVVRQDFF